MTARNDASRVDSVPAVDPSRSSPNDALTSPLSSPLSDAPGAETPRCTMCGEPLRAINADRKWCENPTCSARNHAVFDLAPASRAPGAETLGALLDEYASAVEAMECASHGDLAETKVRAARAAVDAEIAALTADDPELDATDGAHPAWWRGNDRGVEAACERIAEVLNGTLAAPFTFGSAKLSEVAERVAALTARVERAERERDEARSAINASMDEPCLICGGARDWLHRGQAQAVCSHCARPRITAEIVPLRDQIKEAWGDLEQVYLDAGESTQWILAASELWKRIDAALAASRTPTAEGDANG